jgi:hypothetical protein
VLNAADMPPPVTVTVVEPRAIPYTVNVALVPETDGAVAPTSVASPTATDSGVPGATF